MMLSSGVESGHLYFVPNFRGHFNFFTIKYDVSCKVFVHTLYLVEVRSFLLFYIFLDLIC